MATPAMLAHVITSRYCDHLPFYRQAQILARNGFPVDRSVLAGWAGQACWWLEALQEELAKALFASAKLFADDTPMPTLAPGTGRVKTGRLWAYARDDRPCQDTLRAVLDEVYMAIAQNAPILGTIGTRTLLNRAIFLAVGDKVAFPAKLDSMVAVGKMGAA